MEKACITFNSLQEIDKLPYTGYLWHSDQENPVKVTKDQTVDFSKVDINPFIIEGNLFNEQEQISISIRHDGTKPIITRADLKKAKALGIELKKQNFIAHRIEGVEKLQFTQAWKAEKDEFCNDLEVLKPAWSVFTGFDKEDV